MLNFNNLNIEKSQAVTKPETPSKRKKILPLDFSAIVKAQHDGEEPTNYTRQQESDFSKIEPGNKIALNHYQIIGSWCEVCNDVTMQCCNTTKKKMRCTRCKNDRIYG